MDHPLPGPGGLCPGVSSAGPIQIMFMFGLPEPKGCSLDKCRPNAAWGGPSHPGTGAGLVPGTPFSGEPVEAQRGNWPDVTTGPCCSFPLTAWHHRGHTSGICKPSVHCPSQHRLLTTVPTAVTVRQPLTAMKSSASGIRPNLRCKSRFSL